MVGGSGFIGRKVSEHLRTRDLKIVSFDLVQTASTDDTSLVKADILDPQALQRLLHEYEVQAIVHLVGLPAVDECQRNPQFSFQLNSLSVQSTLEAARLTDIPRVFLASSASVYGARKDREPMSEVTSPEPDTVYGYHKLIAEMMLESYSDSYGINGTAFRIFNVYGADYKLGKDVLSFFLRSALASRPLVVKGGEKFRDFVHVDDVAEAFALAILSDKHLKVLNVGTGTCLSLRELAGLVKEQFPKISVAEEPDPEDGSGRVADVRLARSELGFNPTPPQTAIPFYVRQTKEESLEPRNTKP